MVREGAVAESLLQKVKIELYIISMLPELFSIWNGESKVDKHTEYCIFSFLWENTEDCDLQTDKTKIVALSKNHELFVYEFTIEDGDCNLIFLHSCKEDTLKKHLEVKNISE